MNKFTALKSLEKNGDSAITLISTKEDIVVTTDFSIDYIKQKKRRKFSKVKNIILVFSWTDNRFRDINAADIKNIIPLSKILGNKEIPQ